MGVCFRSFWSVEMLLRTLVFCALLLTVSSSLQAQTWSYVIGQSRSEQQANFCDTETAVDELANIFHRFGAQTGFSALASSPDCSLRVHSFTPVALKKAIKIKLESGDFYTINTLSVTLEDGRTSYLITTRELKGSN